jgi:hypothetical protein
MMTRTSGRRRAAIAFLALLLVGAAAVPAFLAYASSSAQAQLGSAIQMAQASRAYAVGEVAAAGVSGLDTSVAQAHLSAGDGLLSEAQSDLSAGNDASAGIVSAQAAMGQYTTAAENASLSLQDAGLTASLDLAATIGAEAEVNATAQAVAAAAAQVCSGSWVSSDNSTVFAQSCSQAEVDSGIAIANVSKAAEITSQIAAGSSASVSLADAGLLIGQARTRVKSAGDALATVSLYTYAQRGESFRASFLSGLFAKANQTIVQEESAAAALLSAQGSVEQAWSAQSASNVTFAELARSIASVDTGSVSAAASAGLAVASMVTSNLSLLITLAGPLPGSSAVVSAAQSAQASAGAYSTDVGSAATASDGFGDAHLGTYGGYLSEMEGHRSQVQASSVTYLSDYSDVRAQLSAFVGSLLVVPPGLLSVNSDLNALAPQSASASQALNGELGAEVSAMAAVNQSASEAASLAQGSALLVPVSAVEGSASAASVAATYLNSSSATLATQAGSDVSAYANASADFASSSREALAGTVGLFGSAAPGLEAKSASLSSQESAAVASTGAASAAFTSDSAMRSDSMRASAGFVSTALADFSAQLIPSGVAAMAKASAELQVAAAANFD